MYDKMLKAILGLSLLASLVIGPSAMASPYTKIVVFGDTLSDVGNYYRATKQQVPQQQFYFVDPTNNIGRFSNDTLWVEQLAALYNPTAAHPLLPNTGTPAGLDYAWAYAAIDHDVAVTTPNRFVVPSVYHQVQHYLVHVGQKADPNALYVIWAGMTDLIDDVEQGKSVSASSTAALAHTLVDLVVQLKAAGAQNFEMPTVPDIAYLPEIQSLNLATKAKGVVHDFNTAVTADLAVASVAKGITVIRPDIFYLQRSVLESSNHLNFTNVTGSCVTPSAGQPTTLCDQSVQSGYFYWDGRNFSSFASSMFAASVITATPAARAYPFK
jgi:phospholipase/lecithinase/hemolysin